MQKLIRHIVTIASVVVIGAGAIIGNMIALNYESQIDSLLTPPRYIELPDDGGEEANEGVVGQELSKQIVEDGTVLLKNEGEALPLDKTNSKERQINVFGWSSVQWLYGAGGSGQVQPENGDKSTMVDFLKAISEYGGGVNYNRDLEAMYKKYKAPDFVNGGSGRATTNPSIDDRNWYTQDLLDKAKAYSDVAVVVIGRWSAESQADRTFNELKLTDTERGLLKYCGSTYKKTIVLISSTNPMELGDLETIDGIDSVLFVGCTGTRGARGLPRILYGDVNPSAKLTDTFAYDFKSSPVYNYVGADGIGKYTNTADFSGANLDKRTMEAYTDYVEGIYVGYKWYETADNQGVWNNVSNAYGQGYKGVVQYPFGYGLSYTNFDWALKGVKVENLNEEGKYEEVKGNNITDKSRITIDVNVHNAGKVAGKDVVEVYLTAPFTAGGIEKSYVSLMGEEKTGSIAPGESEEVSIVMDASDFASYDCYDANKNGFKGYELEDGEYQLKLMTDSHTIKTGMKDAEGKDFNGISTFKVESGASEKSILIKKDKYTGEEVKNRFTGDDAVDGMSMDGNGDKAGNANIQFLKRGSFPDPFSMTRPNDRALSQYGKDHPWVLESEINEWDNATTDVWGDPVHTEKVTWGAKNNLSLTTGGQVNDFGLKLGKDFNDPDWDKLLDQLTIDGAVKYLGTGYQNNPIEEIGKPKLSDYDGPSQIKGYTGDVPRGVGYPSSTVLAQTWDKALAEQFGFSYGKDCNGEGTRLAAGVWGFGTNIHRTPIGGRNFEYYSEDPMLSSFMVTNAVKGLNSTATYCFLKHFVMNDTEQHRSFLFNWGTEQALREVYLKPFQKAIQEGDATGLMTTYGRLGGVYTGGSQALIDGVVRKEWGFKGSIVSDYAADSDGTKRFMSLDQAVRAGSDVGMAIDLNNQVLGFKINYSETSSNRLQYQIRNAVKHSVYSWLRVNYINSVDGRIKPSINVASWKWWLPTMYALDIFIAGGLALWLFLDLFNPDAFKKNKKTKEATPSEPLNKDDGISETNKSNEDVISTSPSSIKSTDIKTTSIVSDDEMKDKSNKE